MIDTIRRFGMLAAVAAVAIILAGSGLRIVATIHGGELIASEAHMVRTDEPAAAMPAVPRTTPPAAPLDFDLYRRTVEPILKAERPFVGIRGACVSCHTWQASTPMKLERLQVGDNGEVYWTEEQSRRNFEVVSALVVPGRPEVSRLAVKPLAQSAGGAPVHTGGKFWDSTDDPEYRAIAEWIRSGTGGEIAAAPIPPPLDFEFFRTCVQKVFLDQRPGLVKCASCHTSGANGFARTIGEGRDFWNEEESRANFSVIQRLVDRGNPQGSRFLMHPLALEAGGDNMHNGGRRWLSQDDPEWQMLAAWVRGERPQCVL